MGASSAYCRMRHGCHLITASNSSKASERAASCLEVATRAAGLNEVSSYASRRLAELSDRSSLRQLGRTHPAPVGEVA